MADNSLQGGSDVIRDIDRSGSGPKTQVAQIDFGGAAPNPEQLVTRANPMPVGNTAAITGTITNPDVLGGTPDGFGTPILIAPVAGSFVALAVPPGAGSWTLVVTGYNGGTIYTESSGNSTTGSDGAWVPVKGRKTGTPPGVEIATFQQVANGEYRGNCAALTWLRARLVGGSGTPTVTLVASTAVGAVFLNSGNMPSGSVIGKVGIDPAANVVAFPVNAPGAGSLSEQMQLLLAAQYATVNLLAQIAALMRGREVLPGDEGDALIGEYLDPRNTLPTLAN